MKPYENQMPAGVDSFVEEASKEEVKAPEKPMQQKFTSKDYGNVRVYPNETGSNMDKNNKWIGKRYSLMEAHKLDDNYLKNNLVGKTKSGADIYKMPDGYFSGNPRINDASFKNVQDLEDFEKKSGEHRAAMKEGTYLDDYIKNYNQPKQSPEQKLMGVKSVRDAVIDDTLKDTKVNKDIVKKAADAEFNQEQTEQKPNIVTYGNSSKFLEKYGLDKYFEFDGMDLVDKRDYSTTAINFGRDGKSEEELLNEIKKYYPNLSKKEQPEVDEDMERAYGPMYDEETGELNPAYRRREEDISDEELKEELVDNKYYYENARSEEEIAKWLAERQDIPYDRALAFVKANYKGGEIWSEGKTYEPFDKYEDDIRAKAKEISDSMKAIGYYNLGNKDQLEQAYQDLAYDLKEEFPMVDPKEIEKYVAEEGINLY